MHIHSSVEGETTAMTVMPVLTEINYDTVESNDHWQLSPFSLQQIPFIYLLLYHLHIQQNTTVDTIFHANELMVGLHSGYDQTRIQMI